MNVLVLLKSEIELSDYNTRLLGAAQCWQGNISVFVPGECSPVYRERLSCIEQIRHVYVAEGISEADCIASHDLAAEFMTLIEREHFTKVLAGDDSLAKCVLPQVAVKLGVGQISGVIELLSSGQFVRSTYTRNINEIITSLDSTQVVSCHPVSFACAEKGGSHDVTVETIRISHSHTHRYGHCVEVVNTSPHTDISSAKRIISIGRGVENDEVFDSVCQFAEKHGFVLGGTKMAIDLGRIDYDQQVGQSGKSVAPDVYLALGVSGAKHHLAGIRDAKVIIAVNKDPEAPIMSVADYIFVGDVADVIPKLNAIFNNA